MPRANTAGFPRFWAGSYADVRRHFDDIKPWNSIYNPHNERPIGKRAIKTNDGHQFNKAMRMLGDESIAFRLFDTDCVIWHPDGTLTIRGWPSISTSGFIDSLSPAGIRHSFRGRRYPADPVLRLMPAKIGDYGHHIHDFRSGEVILCDEPVRLYYSADRWRPLDPDKLQPFYVPTIDLKAARQVSREYHLSTLQNVVNAITALVQVPPPPVPWAPGSVAFADIMEHLRYERYMDAVALMPRGQSQSFGTTHGTADGIKPGFIARLRSHIYEHEGVITTVKRKSLSPSAYARYITDLKKLGH